MFSFASIFGSILNPRSKSQKNDKKELQISYVINTKNGEFPRFPSFLFCSIPKIENLETSGSFRLLQKLIVSIDLSVGKPKIFFEFQVNRPHVNSKK